MQKGLFDAVPTDKVKALQLKLADFLETRKEAILKKIVAKKQFDEEIEKELAAALEEFKSFNS